MLPVDIAALSEGTHEVTLTPEPDEVGLEPEAFSDIAVDARLDLNGRRLFVSFQVRAVATLQCDRTLRTFHQPVAGNHLVLFAPPEEIGNLATKEQEVYPLADGDREIDIADPVRETILLALPTRRIAPGAEEEDIPTRFGDEGEGDPRWEALRRLRDDES
jgi:uncharacterized protein